MSAANRHRVGKSFDFYGFEVIEFGLMQKVIRTGNSLAVTIPAQFVRSVGIRAGDNVKVELKPDSGKAIYSFFGAKQLPLPGEIISKKRRQRKTRRKLREL